MGLFSNRGPSKGRKKTGPKTIRLSSIHGGHSPDRRPANARAQARRKSKPPIEVERDGRGYRLIDGCDRVHFAREARGDRTIRAYVRSPR